MSVPVFQVNPCPSLGEGSGTPLQYSCLENPMDGGTWWAAVHGVVKSQTRLSDFIFTFHSHALEKEMATHSSVLAWRIPGTEEPGRLPSLELHRVGHDWSDLAVATLLETISFFSISGTLWFLSGMCVCVCVCALKAPCEDFSHKFTMCLSPTKIIISSLERTICILEALQRAW